jgi:RNA polymerase sigma factor (sigma-70 family)
MELTDNEKDAQLWNQFKYGDENAFAGIFRKYYTGLYNYGCRITNDTSMVEDCIQELFLDMWRTQGRADILSLRAYIFRAFKFKLIKLLAKGSKTTLTGDENIGEAFELSHDILMINKELDAGKAKLLSDAVNLLSPRQKEIIYLKFYLNLSYEEVSNVMQINYQAARNLIYKAIKELKNTAQTPPPPKGEN